MRGRSTIISIKNGSDASESFERTFKVEKVNATIKYCMSLASMQHNGSFLDRRR